MKEIKNTPSFEQELYLQTHIAINEKDYQDLMSDIDTIEEVQECIEYVTEEQSRNNDLQMSDRDAYAKWQYAKYYMACRTAKYLGDYALTLCERLKSKFVEGRNGGGEE